MTNLSIVRPAINRSMGISTLPNSHDLMSVFIPEDCRSIHDLDIDSWADKFSSITRPQKTYRSSEQPEIGRNSTYLSSKFRNQFFFEPAPSVAASLHSQGFEFWPASHFYTYDCLFESAHEKPYRVALKQLIKSFSDLQPNWDGNGGAAPIQAACSTAQKFIDSLSDTYLPIKCMAAGDGEVILQWNKEDSFIEVAFDGETVSWYARIGADNAIFSDDIFISVGAIDRRLRAAISKFF